MGAIEELQQFVQKLKSPDGWETPERFEIAEELEPLVAQLEQERAALIAAGERMYENCPWDALAVAWKAALRSAGEPAKEGR